MLKRTLSSSTLLILVAILLFPFSATAKDDQVGYSVQALIPENQLDNKHSYFDLLMEPNQEQELEVMIYNNENEDMIVRISVHHASTNSNGLVVYEDQEEIDPSLEVPLEDILTLREDQVVIRAGKSKRITAELDMPKEEYDGIILGGLHFEKVMDEEEASEGVSLQNKYAYVIGVQLSENDHEVFPEVELTSVQPELVNHRTAVVSNLQNSQPVLIEDMAVEAEIYKQGEKEALKSKKQEQINMAPNSTMNFTIDWENEALEPGDYILKMKATHQSEIWEWEEPFVIEKDDAKTINEDAVDIDDDQISIWFVLGIAALVLIIAGLLLYIWKLKRKEDHAEDSNDDPKREEVE